MTVDQTENFKPDKRGASGNLFIKWTKSISHADAVWAAVAAGIALYFVGFSLAVLVWLLYGSLIMGQKMYWSRLISHTIYSALAVIAALRFDLAAAWHGMLYEMLPALAIAVLLKWYQQEKVLGSAEVPSKLTNWVPAFMKRWRAKAVAGIASLSSKLWAKMHFPGMPIGILISSGMLYLVKDYWFPYAGAAVILVIAIVFRKILTWPSVIMMYVVYSSIILLFAQRGLELLRQEPLAYLEAHWGSLVFQLMVIVLMMIGAWLRKRKQRHAATATA